MSFSVIIPTRNNLNHANCCIEKCLSSSEYEIIVIDDCSSTPLDYLQHDRVKIIRNQQKTSLCSLWNQGVRESKTEGVIILSHKTRPSVNTFSFFRNHINRNYALVAPIGFHFFGCYKYLFNRIKMFDSNAPHAGTEDNDVIRRLYEANLSWFITNTHEEVVEGSSWGTTSVGWIENHKYFDEYKWNCVPTVNFDKASNSGYKLIRKVKEPSPQLNEVFPSRNFLDNKFSSHSYYAYKMYSDYENCSVRQ